MPPGRKKKGSAAKKPKTCQPPPQQPDAYRLTGEGILLDRHAYPVDAQALVFCPYDDTIPMPESAFPFLRHELSTLTTELFEELLMGGRAVIIAAMPLVKRRKFTDFCLQKIQIPGTEYTFHGSRSSFHVFCDVTEACRVPNDSLFSSDSDFEMPGTTSESDDTTDSPPARKQPATPARKPTFTKDRCMLQDLRASVSTLPPAPVPASQPFPPAEPEPVEPADVSPPSSPDVSPSVESSRRSAPDARPQQPRRPRFRYKAVDFSTLQVEPPVSTSTTTVLFRPVDKTVHLGKSLHPKAICRQLSAFGEFVGIRDIRDGGLAIDFPAGTDVSPLLSLRTLAEVAVFVSFPAAASTCSAVLSGVHPQVTDEELLEDLLTSPPAKVVAVKRLARPGQESWSVKVTFEGTSVPLRGLLYGRSRALRPYVDKPLQCLNCGRFGHAIRACRSSRRCWICSQEHETEGCPNEAKPDCGNCGGAHPANDVSCPTRHFQAKVCEVRATNHVSHRVARIAVQRAARSYADAARAAKPGPQPARSQEPGSPARSQEPRSPARSQQPGKEPLPATPRFLPNVAHPRPPPAQAPADFAHLAVLFRGLLTILTAAAASGDFAGALAAVSSLFQQQAPGADPGLFAV